MHKRLLAPHGLEGTSMVVHVPEHLLELLLDFRPASHPGCTDTSSGVSSCNVSRAEGKDRAHVSVSPPHVSVWHSLLTLTPSISLLVTPQGSSTLPPRPLCGTLGAHGAVEGATAQPWVSSRQHQGYQVTDTTERSSLLGLTT